MTIEIETKRLKLRQWKICDQKPFAELNADPEVMEYFPSTLSESESEIMMQSISSKIETNGWGFWALEFKATHDFIGFVGINHPTANLPFNPCIEIGWRLFKQHWGKGYATEAALAAMRFAFEHLSINEVVSFTSVRNKRSQAVMRKLNMTDTKENFMHPSVPAGDELQEHVLFKITEAEWRRAF